MWSVRTLHRRSIGRREALVRFTRSELYDAIMRLGILSDTHGKLDATIAAVRTLRDAGAEFYIHCGDVGGEAILDQLAGLPSAFVFGNNDYDRQDLARYAASIDVRCLREF